MVALKILGLLKECSISMPIFGNKLMVDLNKIDETYTNILYNEYFKERSKILSIVQTKLNPDSSHLKENLSFYENTFKPKYKKYIDRITKETSFDDPSLIKYQVL